MPLLDVTRLVWIDPLTEPIRIDTLEPLEPLSEVRFCHQCGTQYAKIAAFAPDLKRFHVHGGCCYNCKPDLGFYLPGSIWPLQSAYHERKEPPWWNKALYRHELLLLLREQLQ